MDLCSTSCLADLILFQYYFLFCSGVQRLSYRGDAGCGGSRRRTNNYNNVEGKCVLSVTAMTLTFLSERAVIYDAS
jgi:hypothetical protein